MELYTLEGHVGVRFKIMGRWQVVDILIAQLQLTTL
jgi:hypothetical protein